MGRHMNFEKTAKEISALSVVEGEHKARLRARLLSGFNAKEKSMSTRMRIVLATCAACLVVLAVSFLMPSQTPTALAATIEALKKATSMICTTVIETEREGEVEVVNMAIYWSDGKTRIDWGGEGEPVHQTVWIEPGRTTTLDYSYPEQPSATVVLNSGDDAYLSGRMVTMGSPESAEDILEMLSRSRSVEVVGQTTEAGRTLSVLRLEQDDGSRQDVELVVDLASNLPISVTHVFEGGVATQNYEWNVSIEPRLMLVQLPEDIEVKVIDADEQAPPLPVIPAVGIGPVRLGMTSEEVIQVLGRPEKALTRSDGSVSNFGYTKSLGISIAFGSDEDERDQVIAISGGMHRFMASRYRDFTGTTPEGIGLGATAEEIIEAYGKTDNHTISQSGKEIIVYEQPSLDFRLSADPKYGWRDDARRTYTIMITKYPTPKRASFRH